MAMKSLTPKQIQLKAERYFELKCKIKRMEVRLAEIKAELLQFLPEGKTVSIDTKYLMQKYFTTATDVPAFERKPFWTISVTKLENRKK